LEHIHSLSTREDNGSLNIEMLSSSEHETQVRFTRRTNSTSRRWQICDL